MFDSPFDYCPKCGEMVLLDQTRRECAAEHRCGDVECPLAAMFSGIDFRSAPEQQPASKPKRVQRRPR
jgi:hypothetical protein